MATHRTGFGSATGTDIANTSAIDSEKGNLELNQFSPGDGQTHTVDSERGDLELGQLNRGDGKTPAVDAKISPDSPSFDQGPPTYDVEEGDHDRTVNHPANIDDVLTKTLHVEDDPTLNALTFRTWFLGEELIIQVNTAC